MACPASGQLEPAPTDNPFLHRAPRDRRLLGVDGDPGVPGKPARLVWSTAVLVDIVRGDLATLRADGGVGGAESCVAEDLGDVRSFTDPTVTPEAGDGLFWLLRSAEACNGGGAGGSYGSVGESAERQIGACPL